MNQTTSLSEPQLASDIQKTELHRALREGVRALCSRYPNEYWRKLEKHGEYPADFVEAMTRAGYLAALIPESYGGGGLKVADASIILEEVNRSGGNAAVCHAQMYIMGALLRHGSDQQKQYYLPKIASGELRLQAFGVTELEAGSDTTSIQTTATRKEGYYLVNGHKNWTSRAQYSDLLLLLARTTPADKIEKRTHGLSLFLVDIRQSLANGLRVQPTETMINHHTTQLFFDNLEVPAENLVGEEGKGFRYVLDGMNVERILIASESLGDGYWFIDHGSEYARHRKVFGQPIGRNQGIQFPLAKSYVHLRAADLMRFDAAMRYDRGEPCGPEANMAKLLAADAAWEAANATLQTYGGIGFDREYDVERKFRETRLYQIAPVSTNMVLSYVAQHLLDLPRSY